MQHDAMKMTGAGQAQLVSPRVLAIVTALLSLLAIASIGISVTGRIYGDRLSLAGHSESTQNVEVVIGRDRLDIPENTIRFETQRQPGRAERLDLYLLWPEMVGYSRANRDRFDAIGPSQSLLFLQISQSTMSRDMSGRVEPIYRHLLAGQPQAGPSGLTLDTFKPTTGYDGEVLLTGDLPDGQAYAIRCMLPAQPTQATSSDCQRDIHVGEDLTVLYRFSSTQLQDWQAIDAAVRRFISERSTTNTTDMMHKTPGKSARERSS